MEWKENVYGDQTFKGCIPIWQKLFVALSRLTPDRPLVVDGIASLRAVIAMSPISAFTLGENQCADRHQSLFHCLSANANCRHTSASRRVGDRSQGPPEKYFLTQPSRGTSVTCWKLELSFPRPGSLGISALWRKQFSKSHCPVGIPEGYAGQLPVTELWMRNSVKPHFFYKSVNDHLESNL